MVFEVQIIVKQQVSKLSQRDCYHSSTNKVENDVQTILGCLKRCHFKHHYSLSKLHETPLGKSSAGPSNLEYGKLHVETVMQSQ